MSTGIMITLIICVTIILLFGTIMIAATVLAKNKQDNDRGHSTGPHMHWTNERKDKK